MIKPLIKQKVILQLHYPLHSVIYTKPHPNILKFKMSEASYLSDQDIGHMFNAFVSLIKKNCKLKAKEEFRNQIIGMSEKLDYYEREIERKNSQIKMLSQILLLKQSDVSQDKLQKLLSKIKGV